MEVGDRVTPSEYFEDRAGCSGLGWAAEFWRRKGTISRIVGFHKCEIEWDTRTVHGRELTHNGGEWNDRNLRSVIEYENDPDKLTQMDIPYDDGSGFLEVKLGVMNYRGGFKDIVAKRDDGGLYIHGYYNQGGSFAIDDLALCAECEVSWHCAPENTEYLCPDCRNE